MNFNDLLVRSEKYLLGFMISIMGVLVIFFVWDGIDTYQKFHRIINNDPITLNEEKLDLLNLQLTALPTRDSTDRLRYITVTELSYTMGHEEKLEMIENASIDTKIAGLEYNPSFLVEERHTGFWKTQFIWYLVLQNGGWLVFSLLTSAFIYINLKQDNKLLTKEIQRIINSAFILTLIGLIGYHFLNHRLINFLNSEFQLNESAGALTSDSTSIIFFGWLIAYTIIAKAVPVQEEQDLTV